MRDAGSANDPFGRETADDEICPGTGDPSPWRGVYALHPDRPIIASLPGAGPALKPRLIAALGTRRDRFEISPELGCVCRHCSPQGGHPQPNLGTGAGPARSSFVSRGDVSAEGIKAKTERVLGIMTERLQGMNVAWSDVTQSNIYTVHNIYPLMEPTVMPALHEGGRHGVRWHFPRPPVLGIEFKMDLRGVQREITVSG